MARTTSCPTLFQRAAQPVCRRAPPTVFSRWMKVVPESRSPPVGPVLGSNRFHLEPRNRTRCDEIGVGRKISPPRPRQCSCPGSPSHVTHANHAPCQLRVKRVVVGAEVVGDDSCCPSRGLNRVRLRRERVRTRSHRAPEGEGRCEFWCRRPNCPTRNALFPGSPPR